jgi:hypothetical protein
MQFANLEGVARLYSRSSAAHGEIEGIRLRTWRKVKVGDSLIAAAIRRPSAAAKRMSTRKEAR